MDSAGRAGWDRADVWLGATAGLAVLSVAIALVTQHVFGMLPCPWCVLQRVIFLLLAAGALLGLVWRSPAGRRAGAALGLAFAGCGIAAALWQHFVAASSASCNLTLADRLVSASGLDALLPDVFAPMASCADAMVDLLGLPYEAWSLGLYLVLAAALWRVLRRPA